MPTPGSQLALQGVGYTYHAVYHPIARGNTLALEADHRRHAEIENTIRDVKYGMCAQPHALGPLRRQRCLAGLQRDRPSKPRPVGDPAWV